SWLRWRLWFEVWRRRGKGLWWPLGLAALSATDNHVPGNVILDNQPDLFWGGSGARDASPATPAQQASHARCSGDAVAAADRTQAERKAGQALSNGLRSAHSRAWRAAGFEPIRRDRFMRWQTTGTGALLAIALALAPVAPASARTKGHESYRAVIVASGLSGARNVVGTLIAFKGVFTSSGRLVEVASRPSDPANVLRDDLIFPGGKMHLVSSVKSFTSSVDPKTCAARIRVRQTGRIRGGTGRFRHAAGRFVGTLNGWGVAPRNPDGTCSQQGESILEVAIVSGHGTLSF